MSEGPRRVLIAEDNYVHGKVLQVHLEMAGLDVTLARNGAEAWDLLERSEFHLVVADYVMPRLDGMELCLRMRKHPRHSRIPALLITAKGMELELTRLREMLGVVDAIAKPFSLRAFTKTVLAALEPAATNRSLS